MHSQRLSEAPLLPWIISKLNGEIICGHCNCMAGLAEVCTHVAALLFWVEISVKIRESSTVTDKPAYWVAPSNPTKIIPKQVKDIDFRAPKQKKKELEESIHDLSENRETEAPANKIKKTEAITKPSKDELENFYATLNNSTKKPGILRILPAYVDQFRSKSSEMSKQVLTNLYDPENVNLNQEKLLELCKENYVKLKISTEEAENIESATRDQNTSTKWFLYRGGRVTASVAKAVCRTNPNNPSVSLIKKICYQSKFRSIATDWGCDHEKVAREAYIKIVSKNHTNVVVRDSGLVVHPNWPHMGASPDSIVECSCCGVKCLEIKCPYSFRDKSIEFLIEGNSYLYWGHNLEYLLKEDHEYYYQIQTQLLVTELQSCHFFVWTKTDYALIVVEANKKLQDEIVSKSSFFFENVLLKELLAKHFTENKLPEKSTNTNDDKWCFCRMGENEDNMIQCENKNCNISWFHQKCVRIKKVPKGRWFCPDCRKNNSTSKSKN